jgi:glyoxylase-like metal-dependent hydrolase (beta-lactamase superfamily II)
MQEVAPGVWLLKGIGIDIINVYVAGDVLIDASTRWHTWHLKRQLRGRSLSAVALTHCHPDHQGAARHFCRMLQIPLACHEADVPAMEGTGPMLPNTFIVNRLGRLIAGRPHPVRRVLRAGDEIAGFRVVHAPGHTPGHVIFFRDSDRVAIAGDVLANMSFLTFKPGLRPPPAAFCTDPVQNRRSIELLAGLNPSLVCFGHGPPLDKVDQLHWFVERMRKREAAAGPV